MGLNFTGDDIIPKRGTNLTGRKTTGVRVSVLKKGQKVITIGEDVLKEMGVGDIGDGLKVRVRKGSGATWEGKLMVQVAEDGALTLRYVNKAKKTAAHIMSASLPFDVSAKCKIKVYANDKAVVLMIPTESDAEGKAAEKASGDAPAGEGEQTGSGDDASTGDAADADFAAS